MMQKRKRGIVLLLALFALAPLVVMAQAMLVRSVTEVRGANRNADLVQSFHLADAGVDEALVDLRDNGQLDTGGWQTDVTNATNTRCPSGETCWQRTLALPEGNVELLVRNPTTDTPQIIATGTSGFVSQSVEAVLAVQRTTTTYPDAIDATGRMSFGYYLDVDSYDSRLGAYGAILTTPDPRYNSLNQSDPADPDGQDPVNWVNSSWHGTLRTDGTSTVTPKAIETDVAPDMYGPVQVGVGVSPATAALGVPGGTTMGPPSAESSWLNLPRKIFTVYPAAVSPTYQTGGNCGAGYVLTVNIPNDDALDGSVDGVLHAKQISGGSGCHVDIIGPGVLHLDSIGFSDYPYLTIKGGPVFIYVKDHVSLSNGANIELNPGTSVVFKVTGRFAAGNSLMVNDLGTNPKPRDVEINVIPDPSDPAKVHEVAFGNGGTVYATIYAPDSEVGLGQGKQFYGSIVGSFVHGAHQTNIHYDESLATNGPTQSAAIVTIAAWRELTYAEAHPLPPAPKKVICTELYRQGYIPADWIAADVSYATGHVDGYTMAGYHFWAVPLVRQMERSRFVTQLIRPFGAGWAQHMAYEVGVAEHDSWLGRLMDAFGVPGNYVLGRYILRYRAAWPPTSPGR